MLYLSRYRPNESYGVVDTDDDVEEVVGRNDLRDAVMEHGLSIEGITLEAGLAPRLIRLATPYQDERYITTLMLKTRMVYGVEVRVWRDEVTYLCADQNVTPRGYTLRLSDYGKRFCGFSVVKWAQNRPDNHMIIVLDDNIELIDRCPKMGTWGICYDVRELSDTVMIDNMYRELIKGNNTEYECWDSWILDNHERFYRWQCAGMLNSTVPEDSEFVVNFRQSPLWHGISAWVGEMYKAEFGALANTDVSKTFFTSMGAMDFVGFVSDFLQDGIRRFRGVRDYCTLWGSCRKFTQLLKLVSTINSYALTRFENYFNFFDVPSDMKEIYVEFCHNTIVGLIKYCDETGMPLEV